jgi:parallel beta-helix repeat protein
VCLLVAACTVAPTPDEIVLDRDDIEIARSVVVRPGAYCVQDRNGDGVLRVVAAGVTLTLHGVTLDGAAPGAEPDRYAGVGIVVSGCSNVRIVGGALRGFRVAVRGERADGIVLDGVDVSGNRAMRLRSTPAREHGEDWLWPHENDRGEWETRYGAGIALSDCVQADVRRCRARGSQNGLLLTRCNGATVRDNDFSFLSGWGIALYRCSRCEVVQNRCDFCVRGYSHGVYARGQDSAGILVFEQCADNLFARNSATHSGDGLFLYAGHETTQRTGQGGSNRNLVTGNDFSQAVANGIEATFSAGNQFVGNRLDECEHGIWAGYSYATRIVGNTIRRCANGVSIEHGHDNTITGNAIEDCQLGIHLWWDDDAEFLAEPYGRTQDTSSARNTIRGNRITGAGTPLRLVGDTGSRVELDPVAAAPALPTVSGWPELPRGREHIVVGPWGPLDPRLPALVPFGATGAAAATLRVVGAGLPFHVESCTAGFVAEPASGTAPAVVRVRPAAAAPTAAAAWQAVVRIGADRFPARGLLVPTTWRVQWWSWRVDPREDATAWAALLAGPALAAATTDALEFDWGGRSPAAGVPADRFATVAETTCTLPAGTWRLVTVSDDGIRVLVDGEVVLADWTWHAPKELARELELAAGAHTIRVEHFELDGWSVLHCWLEPVSR